MHGVVLVVTAGQIGELLPRQLVDALDALGEAFLYGQNVTRYVTSFVYL